MCLGCPLVFGSPKHILKPSVNRVIAAKGIPYHDTNQTKKIQNNGMTLTKRIVWKYAKNHTIPRKK